MWIGICRTMFCRMLAIFEIRFINRTVYLKKQKISYGQINLENNNTHYVLLQEHGNAQEFINVLGRRRLTATKWQSRQLQALIPPQKQQEISRNCQHELCQR